MVEFHKILMFIFHSHSKSNSHILILIVMDIALNNKWISYFMALNDLYVWNDMRNVERQFHAKYTYNVTRHTYKKKWISLLQLKYFTWIDFNFMYSVFGGRNVWKLQMQTCLAVSIEIVCYFATKSNIYFRCN